jgi:2-C-methyl-D-erythritol 2,4-cyclodiphosphate synthase
MELDNKLRIGMGYDVHRLVPNRPLVLGGVDIPHDLGLLGHSDADVLAHAAMDAMLGAAGLGDIGLHFPDSDAQYRGISSLILLKRVKELLRKAGYGLVNLDSTVFAQAPRLSPYRLAMGETLARTLEVSPNRINVKATTTEQLGFIGRGEGIAAQCVVLIQSRSL